MAVPSSVEHREPILIEVTQAGGQLKATRDETGRGRVMAHFPPGLVKPHEWDIPSGLKQLRTDDPCWWKVIRTCAKKLKDDGLLERRRDVWEITAEGKRWLEAQLKQWTGDPQAFLSSRRKLYEIRPGWVPREANCFKRWSGAERSPNRRGRARIVGKAPPLPREPVPSPAPPAQPSLSLAELVAGHFAEIKERLSAKISSLSAEQFEYLIAGVLGKVGYEDVRRTGGPGDRNIDVTATYAAPFIKVPVRVQVKHRQGNGSVGPTDVAAFRDRAGGVDHVLLMVTNGRFTDGAFETASEQARQCVHMIDGENLVKTLTEKKIGVRDGALGFPEIDEEFFAQFEATQ